MNRLIKNYGRSTMARNAHKSILDGRTNQPTKQVIESRTRDRKVSTQSHRCKFLYIIFFSNIKKKPQKPRLKYNVMWAGAVIWVVGSYVGVSRGNDALIVLYCIVSIFL